MIDAWISKSELYKVSRNWVGGGEREREEGGEREREYLILGQYGLGDAL